MNKGKTIIVWILIILLLGVIGYCGYQIVDRLNGNESSKTEEKKEEKKDEVETELTDSLVKQDVLDKLSYILATNKFDENNFSSVGWNVSMNRIYVVNNLLTNSSS